MAERASKELTAISGNLKLVAGAITSLGVIVGAVVAAVNFALSPITSRLDSLEQSTTRGELLTLMSNYPEDRRAIEELAYKYFAELKGDSYVYGLYADWANAHNVDYAHITEIHNLNR